MSCHVNQPRWIVLVALMMAALIAFLPATEAATYSLTYDANGNLVTGDGKYRVYDAFNHLSRIYNGSDTSGVLLQEYIYHPTEDRILVKKTYNSTGSVIETVSYVSDSFARVTNTSGTYNTTYVLANGQQVAQTLPDGTTQFLLNDLEGSVAVTTNASGGVVERTSYTPYGDVFTGGTKTRFDYEGREGDSLVGDTDFRFRKYKPAWGLFTQPDNIIQNLYDPQTLNRYSFERNSPYKYVDPSGHVYWDKLGSAVFWGGLSLAGAALGVAGAEFGGVTLIATATGLASAGYETLKARAALTEDDKWFQEHEDNVFAETGAAINKENGARIGNIAAFGIATAGAAHDIPTGTDVLNFQDDLASILSFMDWSSTLGGLGQNPVTPPPNPSQASPNQVCQIPPGRSGTVHLTPGFVRGVGYISAEGHLYPTTNAEFVPGQGSSTSGGSSGGGSGFSGGGSGGANGGGGGSGSPSGGHSGPQIPHWCSWCR
jgi:RHS repeat-associated protein